MKGIIFDLDGTLCDTLGDLQAAMNRMLRHFGWPERSREELLRFINRGARNFVADSMPEGSFREIEDPLVTEALAVYAAYYEEAPLVHTKPFPGIPAALLALKGQGMRLGVLSNKQDKMVQRIISSLFPGVFDAVAGNLDLPIKPDPAPALAVAKRLSLAPADCIFCGDSDIDMKTGVNAGMFPLGVTWGYRDPPCLLAAGAGALLNRPLELPGFTLTH